MSIAVSTTLRPSRIGLSLLGVMLLLVNFSLGWTVWTLFHQIMLLALLTGIGVLAGGFSLFYMARHQKTYRLDMDTQGQIILRCLATKSGQALELASVSNVLWSSRAELGKDTTIWPNVLLLHFKLDNAQIERIVVLPDSVDPVSFKHLRVALRWLMSTQKTLQQQGKTENQGNFPGAF